MPDHVGEAIHEYKRSTEQDDSYVDLALKPKNLSTIDINSSVTLAYKDPKGDQTSKVVEDLFGNDLDSFSGYGVEIVKIWPLSIVDLFTCPVSDGGVFSAILT